MWWVKTHVHSTTSFWWICLWKFFTWYTNSFSADTVCGPSFHELQAQEDSVTTLEEDHSGSKDSSNKESYKESREEEVVLSDSGVEEEEQGGNVTADDEAVDKLKRIMEEEIA